jgi:hypothetical protein
VAWWLFHYVYKAAETIDEEEGDDDPFPPIICSQALSVMVLPGILWVLVAAIIAL